MAQFRQIVQDKPWIGWAVAGGIGVVALLLAFRDGGGGDAYSTARMTEMVTIKFLDTGETVQMPRGRLVRELMLLKGPIDPEKGIINPKTGQPTGFIFDKDEWTETVSRINEDKARAQTATQAENGK
ncbi:MAG: hypothetical protein AB7K52_09980 [Phycisphaerales bacterium]